RTLVIAQAEPIKPVGIPFLTYQVSDIVNGKDHRAETDQRTGIRRSVKQIPAPGQISKRNPDVVPEEVIGRKPTKYTVKVGYPSSKVTNVSCDTRGTIGQRSAIDSDPGPMRFGIVPG